MTSLKIFESFGIWPLNKIFDLKRLDPDVSINDPKIWIRPQNTQIRNFEVSLVPYWIRLKLMFKFFLVGPVYVPNFPPSILVQPSYDSRTVETRISDKAIEFIRDSIRQDPGTVWKLTKISFIIGWNFHYWIKKKFWKFCFFNLSFFFIFKWL